MKSLSNFNSLLLLQTILFLPPLLPNGVHVCVSARVYNVIVPTQIPYKCPVSSCLTLSQFAQNFTDNNIIATLLISRGNHNLNVGLSVSNLIKFVMISTSSANHTPSPVITCTGREKLKFSNVSSVYFSGLKFLGCNESRFEFIQNLTVESSVFSYSESPIAIVESEATFIGTNFYFNSGRYTSDSDLLKRQSENPNQPVRASLGGALLVIRSIVVVENCDFVGNTANFGGAIYSEINSSINITRSHFMDNHANGCSGHCSGGAILIDSGVKMIVSNSVFYNNTSDIDGGVATVINSSLLFSDYSSIQMNTARRHGGAVAAFSNSKVALIESTQLSDNEAGENGGGVHLQNSSITVSDCEISGNSALREGGAISEVHASHSHLKNSVLEHNQAQKNGGALYGQNNSIVAVSNCTVVNNTAAEKGGVAHINFDSSLYLSISKFSGNNASIDGGVAFVFNKSMVSVEDCNFDNNWADDYGGAIRVEKSSRVAVSNSKFVDNRASYGAALEINDHSNVSITSSNFSKNSAENKGAAIQLYVNCAATINGSTFNWNEAGDLGGVYGRRNCTLSIRDSVFYHNAAEHSGAGVYIGHDSAGLIDNCTFFNSTADFGAAIVAYVRSNVTITNSRFTQNRAAVEGGALHAYRSCSIEIQGSNFTLNKARSGGVFLALLGCKLTLQDDDFFNNSADFGGVIGSLIRNNITVTGSSFAHNSATQSGGVLYVQHSNVTIDMHSNFKQSSADLFGGVIHATENCTIFVHTATFSNNTADDGGVLSLLDGSIGIVKYSDFIGNRANESGGVVYLNKASIGISHSRFNFSSAYRRGGVLSASATSKVYVTASNFSHNAAKAGAALSIEERSNLSFTLHQDLHQIDYEIITDAIIPGIAIYSNTASRYGGGIYLNESTLSIGTGLNISYNKARKSGGGVHAIHSSILVKSTVNFVSNKASSGGGLSLRYSKFCNVETDDDNTMATVSMNFISNQADNGGALYVGLNKDDEDIGDVCSGQYSFESASDCFFSTMSDAFTINFDNNLAEYEGQDLFGGLLDRCAVPDIVSTNQSLLEPSGIARFRSISNITSLDTISSKPVRVCICVNSTPNCIIEPHSVQVQQRSTIELTLAAVDQVYNEKSATIQFQSRNQDQLKLPENEATQTIGAVCSNLEYHINTIPRDLPYEAKVYADGPCADIGISKLNVYIHVVPCACTPGFEVNEDNKECKCKCDEQLLDYIKECDPETKSVIRKGVFWISTINKTDGNFSYLIFPYCPIGYCQSPNESIPVNLNHPTGADAQCANNHAGLLCGKCQRHYSLSIGSSRCVQCHNRWYGQLVGIVVASVFAGIFLVAMILVLNLTVAVGTLNSVIFYANVVYSNRIFRQSRFISVFISWTNLDIGFDVCFYKGMDAYTKTWLELAFPAYIIFLVVAIIWISSRSSAFSNLIGKRNPVATLATLILISYSKFLQTIIITFSFVKDNGSINPATRWLYDASVVYFGWKHALLFFTAVLILIFGLFYTVFLFSWQWLLHCPRSRVLTWTRNQKLHSFIDTYHTPHTARHRYWTGLLLLVRVILYLIAAFSASVYADPHIPLLATIVVMCCLLLFKTAMMVKVYRSFLLNAIDSFICINIIIPAVFTLHSFTDTTKVIDISVGITVVLLFFIIAFHVYRYGSVKVYTYCQNTKICESITKRLLMFIQSRESGSDKPSDGRLLDILDSLRVDETEEVSDHHEQPTSSVVSLVHSEESPSCDYHMKLTEEESQLSDIDKLWQEREGAAQQGSKNTKKVELSSYFSPDENMRKPLLDDEHL